MRLSVIVPALDEAAAIAAVLDAVARELRTGDELIVVDGGSADATATIAAEHGASVVPCARGRGLQQNVGAAHASGDLLLFLHADTILPGGFRAELERLLNGACPSRTPPASRATWGRFDVAFDHAGPLLRLIAWLISRRSRLTRVATGDQAIFVRRDVFAALGGFHETTLFEDIELTRRLRRRGRMVVPARRATTSARRWRRDGTWRTTFRMWILKSAYLLGVPAERLARHYRDVR